jgi:hypothetical protein
MLTLAGPLRPECIRNVGNSHLGLCPLSASHLLLVLIVWQTLCIVEFRLDWDRLQSKQRVQTLSLLCTGARSGAISLKTRTPVFILKDC